MYTAYCHSCRGVRLLCIAHGDKLRGQNGYHTGMRRVSCVGQALSGLVQDPQQVGNFPRSFREKVRSSAQRRKQRTDEVTGLLEFAESHACLQRRQITAALRIQNPRLWLEYTQYRRAACDHRSMSFHCVTSFKQATSCRRASKLQRSHLVTDRCRHRKVWSQLHQMRFIWWRVVQSRHCRSGRLCGGAVALLRLL